jgi:DNA-binding beta-propeller fold protein YncE
MKSFTRTILVASLMVAGAQGAWLSNAQAAAQARSMPMFEVDKAWPKKPANMKFGDVSSIAIDANDNAWVLTRPRTLKGDDAKMAASPITIFDAAGNYVRGWGGNGNGYEWPEREHGILIDSKGFVWVGGNSCPSNGLPGLKPVADDQLLKFTQDGKFVMQIGHSNQSKGNADTNNLHRPADAQLYPATNELFVADGYGNHRVAVFDADSGKFKRMWGAFGNKPVDADSCEVISYKTFAEPGPQQLSVVHAIRVSKDGTVYVADRENRRVQSFTKDGKFIKQLMKGDAIFARDLAFSPDADQQFLYVGYDKGVAVVDRKTLDYLGTIQPPGILGAGHHIQTDSKGNIYIAQTTAGMQRLTYKGMSPAR